MLVRIPWQENTHGDRVWKLQLLWCHEGRVAWLTTVTLPNPYEITIMVWKRLNNKGQGEETPMKHSATLTWSTANCPLLVTHWVHELPPPTPHPPSFASNKVRKMAIPTHDTSIEFDPHGDVALPCHWENSDNFGLNSWWDAMFHNWVPILIPVEYLQSKCTKCSSTERSRKNSAGAFG